MDADIQEYLPAMLPLACQGIIYAARPKVVPLNSTCKDLQTLEFMNRKNVDVCLPIKKVAQLRQVI